MVADLAWPREGLDHGDICTAMVVDGAAVSMCSCARLTDRAAQASLETLEAYRGRGYAAVVVAAWARAVRDSGRIPFYSTPHDNVASQAVARKLGLIQYAVEFGVE
jgi:predicted GNAT family acetyltransferase